MLTKQFVEYVFFLVSWEFVTTDYDIGFGVYHKPIEMRSKKVHAGHMAEVVSESECMLS